MLHGVLPPTPTPVDPHDHRMWAVVGVYHGQEDNQLFARTDDAVLEPTERFSLTAGEIRPLDAATIHSVQAAGGRYLGAVHVYGGDLFGTRRSTWRDGVEQPNDESALPSALRAPAGSGRSARPSDGRRGGRRLARRPPSVAAEATDRSWRSAGSP